MKIRLLVIAAILAIVAALSWGAMRLIHIATPSSDGDVPTTAVKKGRVVISVSARGELQGGNSEMLTAPMVGGGDLAITDLREPGELVNPGDVVVQFDTTQQEFNLKEAQADLAEAEQQVIQADATANAAAEEAQYLVQSTKSDVKIAELEMRKNPIVPAIQAKQNEIALQAARNRARQAEDDLKNGQATNTAAIAIQKAALNKAKVMAESAQRMIDSMTLKAKTTGYVNVQQNSNQNIMFWGMQLPAFQVGDTARGGMAVAQIPDLKNWEVSAAVGELDRGHLSVNQKVSVSVVALAGKSFTGHVKNIGGTTGPPWDRRFECRIALDQAGPELRPGMTSNMVITVETLDNVLWVPSQALFESDGRNFVYLRTSRGFLPHDVKLVRRGESQAVLAGIPEGSLVAMSNPDQQSKSAAPQSNGAMKALSK